MVSVRAFDARVCLARRADSPTVNEDNGSPPSLIVRCRCLRLLLAVAALSRCRCLWLLLVRPSAPRGGSSCLLLVVAIAARDCYCGCYLCSRLLLVVAARLYGVWRVCLARYDGFALIEQRDFFLAAVPPQDRLLEAGIYCKNDVAHIRIASLHH